MEDHPAEQPAQAAALPGKKRKHTGRFWLILAAIAAAVCVGLYFAGLAAIPLLAAARTASAFSGMKNAGVDYDVSLSALDAAGKASWQTHSTGELFRIDDANGSVGGTLYLRSDGTAASEQKIPYVATFANNSNYTLMFGIPDSLAYLKSAFNPNAKYIYLDSKDLAAQSQSGGSSSSSGASSGSGKSSSASSQSGYARLGADVTKAAKAALARYKPQITRRYDLSSGLDVVLTADIHDFEPERIVDAFSGDAQSVRDLQSVLDQNAGPVDGSLPGGGANANELLQNLKTSLKGQKLELHFVETGSLGGIRSLQLRVTKPKNGGVSFGLGLAHIGERKKIAPLAQPDDADVLNLGKAYQTLMEQLSSAADSEPAYAS